ncbi:MAG: tRNA (adenosine(37)-N6)-dimethylallyltransferase MiaA [Desulfohalobiaceae bacterium]|nr:tRNA (adenosine(37)-N6)-dimethylallyltransferase MiaA [Desulfohalobiaceae bacterium]
MDSFGQGPQKVVCLLGSTGTGKSSLAAFLARNIAAEVINFDSRQVYKRFPVITAQPGPEELKTCRHWLYGFLETDERLDAASFTDLARNRADRITGSGRIPMLVGGTGLYLRSFVKGLAPIPKIPREIQADVRTRCRLYGPERLHRDLQKTDPGAAGKIHPRDRQRVSRALEVYQATGRPISWWQAQPSREIRYHVLPIGLWLDLKPLAPRLKDRIESMIERGAVEEARAAWEKCPREEAPGWSGIGCAEVLQFLLGRRTLDQTRDEWFKKTRAYAKRQQTWFKKEKGIVWISPGDRDRALEAVQRFLESSSKESGVRREE